MRGETRFCFNYLIIRQKCYNLVWHIQVWSEMSRNCTSNTNSNEKKVKVEYEISGLLLHWVICNLSSPIYSFICSKWPNFLNCALILTVLTSNHEVVLPKSRSKVITVAWSLHFSKMPELWFILFTFGTPFYPKAFKRNPGVFSLVFSCEFCEISKSTFLTEYLRTAASVFNIFLILEISPEVLQEKFVFRKQEVRLFFLKTKYFQEEIYGHFFFSWLFLEINFRKEWLKCHYTGKEKKTVELKQLLSSIFQSKKPSTKKKDSFACDNFIFNLGFWKLECMSTCNIIHT